MRAQGAAACSRMLSEFAIAVDSKAAGSILSFRAPVMGDFESAISDFSYFSPLAIYLGFGAWDLGFFRRTPLVATATPSFGGLEQAWLDTGGDYGA